MLASIFNDVIGPVMRGPSSSHCAAALRIGRLARDLVGGLPDSVLVEFDRVGSLPTTHTSQGSDMGLFGGLLGWEASDARLPDAEVALQAAGCKVKFVTVDVGDPHPNTYRLTLTRGSIAHTLRAISTGGGMIEVIAIDDVPLSIHGDFHETLFWCHSTEGADALANLLTANGPRFHAEPAERHAAGSKIVLQMRSRTLLPSTLLEEASGLYTETRSLAAVLPVLSGQGTSAPFTTAAELLRHAAEDDAPLWKHALAYECQRGGLREAEVLDRMLEIVRILKTSIEAGIAGTSYEDRVLPAQAPSFKAALDAGRLLGDPTLNQIVLATTALMEVKSSMGVIVAAPTAGACAALPAAVIAVAQQRGLDDDAMARALLAAGLIGIFITSAWSFAAEVGGCQAEGGSAAAMAAAALVTLADGTCEEALAAAAMALQSMLGLICDPVANRVEVPCLGKNVMAAANALACANMALAGFAEVIPFDEVVAAARTVSQQMPRELRCTALGGLAITPTSRAIEDRLAIRQPSGCGSCGCG
jgi:L-serine dehydratase